MATIKVVLRKKQNRDGTFPLALRITKDRKTSFIHLGYSVSEKDWNADAQRVRKSHPNAARFNNFIVTKLADAGNLALEADTQDKETSATLIKHKLKPAAKSMFFARAGLLVQQLQDTGNFNSWRTQASRLLTFKEFVLGTEAVWNELSDKAKSIRRTPVPGVMAGPDVAFQRIDVALLTRYKVYLKAHKGLADRTIFSYLMLVHAVFSQAIREGVLDRKHFPFGKGKIQVKFAESLKVGLSKEDVERLETIVLDNAKHAAARDIWLVSFAFAGMRAADVLTLRWSDFKDGRLHYVMKKNGKPVSLKVPDKAQAVLNRYAAAKTQPGDFVFPYLRGLEQTEDMFELKRRIAAAVAKCDRDLRFRVAPAAGIEGKISMHIARHTFATLAGDKIPIQMLQKLYRHSNIKTTIGYQSAFIHRDADEALDAVLGE